MSFGVLSVLEQLKHTDAWLNDPRGVLPSGFAELDSLLFRGGYGPGTLCILGGRMHTRKTTVVLNMISRWLKANRTVLLVGLDETNPSYTLKLMSAMYNVPHERIAEEWNDRLGSDLRERYAENAQLFVETHGFRPDTDMLDAALEEAGSVSGRKPDVVVVDYLTQMKKGQYGSAYQKTMDLVENIKTWTNENEVVTLALAQVGRDGGAGGITSNEGHIPLAATDIRQGGEEDADIVFGTYRPALDPIGNLPFDEALELMPEGWKDDKKLSYYQKCSDRVAQYQNATFLQLLKNRPGTKLDKKGMVLVSQGEAMKMVTPLEKSRRDDA